MFYRFNTFTVDPELRQLFDNEAPVHVRHKTFSVLRVLLENAGEVVSRDALLERVWGNRSVSDDVVRISVHETRKVLRDLDRTLIETVHRQGFRFAAEVEVLRHPPAFIQEARGVEQKFGYGPTRKAIAEAWGRITSGGAAEMILLPGEAGIGKTTLIHDSRKSLQDHCFALQAECRELDSQTVSFLALQSAIEGVKDQALARALRAALAKQAPTWRLIMSDRSLGQDEALPTAGRMAREFEDVLAQLGSEQPILLVIDDLQWADSGTLAVLSALVRTSKRLPVLVLAGIRHPLGPESQLTEWLPTLSGAQRVQTLKLSGFGPSEIEEWLQHRLGETPSPTPAASLLELSGGRPLFLEILVSHMVAEGQALAKSDSSTGNSSTSVYQGVPGAIDRRLRLIIESRLDSLDPLGRRVLEAAAVLSETHPVFDSEVLAEVTGEDEGDCEDALNSLDEWNCFLQRAESHLPQRVSEHPIATNTSWDGQYRFQHGFYLDVVRDKVNQARKRELHRTIGQVLEARANGKARDCAHHWRVARQPSRELSARLSASVAAFMNLRTAEMLEHATRGLEILDTQEDASSDLEITFRRLRLAGNIIEKGLASSDSLVDAESIVAQAEANDDNNVLSGLLPILAHSYAMRGEYAPCLSVGERIDKLGSANGSAHLVAESYSQKAHVGLVTTNFEQAIESGHKALLGPEVVHIPGAPGELEPLIGQHAGLSYVYALTGRLKEARSHVRFLEERAARPGGQSAHSVLASQLLAHRLALLGDYDNMRRIAREVYAFAGEYGFRDSVCSLSIMVATGTDQDSLVRTEEAINDLENMGARTHLSLHLATLAQHALDGANYDLVLKAVARASRLGEETGEVWMRPELLRLEGCALLEQGNKAAAENCFSRSLDTAETSGAKLLSLRTATTVYKLAEAGLADVVPSPRELLQSIFDSISPDPCPDAEEAESILSSVGQTATAQSVSSA